jgi:hypothetical protein
MLPPVQQDAHSVSPLMSLRGDFRQWETSIRPGSSTSRHGGTAEAFRISSQGSFSESLQMWIPRPEVQKS